MSDEPGFGERIRQFFTVRLATTFVAATSVTAAVAGPMAWQAQDARDRQQAAEAPAPPPATETETAATTEPDAPTTPGPTATPGPDVLAGVAHDGVFVDRPGAEPVPLHGRTVDGPLLVTFDEDGLAAVAFILYDPEGEVVVEGQDGRGPTFDLLPTSTLVPDPLDTAALEGGLYSLLATFTFEDGRVDRRAAVFAVDDGGGSE